MWYFIRYGLWSRACDKKSWEKEINAFFERKVWYGVELEEIGVNEIRQPRCKLTRPQYVTGRLVRAQQWKLRILRWRSRWRI